MEVVGLTVVLVLSVWAVAALVDLLRGVIVS